MKKNQSISETHISNKLLAALPPEECLQLLPELKPFKLNFGETIYEQNEIIRDIYFPEIGIISLLSSAGDGARLEVGIIGSEGIAGFQVFLGVEKTGNRGVVQGAGSALKMSASSFLQLCRKNTTFEKLLRRFTHSLLTQISHSAVCNRFHQIDARLARWLLMTHDRMKTNEFKLTQDFLSDMLGVRREAVSRAANVFQEKRLIRYSRGTLKILDRIGLEETTCNCYGIIKEEEESLFR